MSDKLTGPRPSGYKGKYGWKNYFWFIVPRKDKVTYIPPPRNLPTVQQREFPVSIKLRIPEISGKQFLFAGLVVFILISVFIFYSAIVLLKEDFEYRQAIRNEMEYRMGQVLIPYETRMELLKQHLVEVESKVQAVMTPRQIDRSIELQEARHKKWIEQAYKNNKKGEKQ